MSDDINKKETTSDDDIKRMSVKEFREKGFLQEANRLFFHPLGLALEVKNVDTPEECLGGIWDYRDDPEGMLFGDETMKKTEAMRKKFAVQNLRDYKLKARIATGMCDDGGIQKFRG